MESTDLCLSVSTKVVTNFIWPITNPVLYMCMHVHELNNQASVSLKVVSHKGRRKCTVKSYDRFTNSYDLRLTTKSDRKVKSGGRYS
jgi:hypothetical protein